MSWCGSHKVKNIQTSLYRRSENERINLQSNYHPNANKGIFIFMQRKYHRYEKWECWKKGFFYNITDEKKSQLSQTVYDFFCDSSLVDEYMNKVIELWPYSCEHNLSNESMNRIAWLGQAASCLFCSANQSITMSVWNTLPIEVRKQADSIAERIISKYTTQHEQNNA